MKCLKFVLRLPVCIIVTAAMLIPLVLLWAFNDEDYRDFTKAICKIWWL